MTLPAYRKHRNVDLTFQARIGDALTVATRGPDGNARSITVPVYWSDGQADPDEVRRPDVTPAPAWIEGAWTQQLAGRRGYSIVQLDVRTRIGAPGDAEGDPFGHVCSDIADAVEAIFAGAESSGRLRAWVPLKDYADPANPVALPSCIFVQTPAGDWGVPQDRRKLPPSGGMQRIVLRFSMRLTHDAVIRGWFAEV